MLYAHNGYLRLSYESHYIYIAIISLYNNLCNLDALYIYEAEAEFF